jgi:hypothetical protein
MIDTEKAEFERVIQQLVAKVEELVAVNAKLRAEKSDALSVLKEAYNDPDVPPALRIKAAGLALPHEVPRLMPERAPLDLPYEEVEPLATLVEKRRARQNALEPPHRVLPNHQIVLLKPNGDSGTDD